MIEIGVRDALSQLAHGPHHALVHSASRGYLESQWWAEQGFAVVVADGRGTPGTPSWEREVRFDLAGAALADQVDALQAVAAAHPRTRFSK